MNSPVRDFFSGVGVLFQGAGMVIRRPRLFLLGIVPPLITSLLFVAALVLLLFNVEDLTVWLTPFAEEWAPGMQTTVRVLAGVLLVAAAVLVMVVAFTGLTLALGAPLYDKIAEMVEDELGDAPPEADDSVTASVVRSVRQSLVLIAVSALVTVPLFAVGFVPIVGQTVIPIVSAMFGGWMLTIELLGSGFDRRGMRRIKDRRRVMGRRRMLVYGFGIPSYLLLAIPFLAVVVFPAAAAGGTILTRRLLTAGDRQAEPGRLPPQASQPGTGQGPPPGPSPSR
ncbi:membrane protein [Streptomonospora alba]|uniref:Membrane protein n=1 Tax=Streptomonospora alba TaxID=183763 RepID=A0A0C2JFG1_9ACTN|nr:EI24 domain-containing protein [Streptomonospora alba]KII00092.1 membrane protein [Streptomonospora alba]